IKRCLAIDYGGIFSSTGNCAMVNERLHACDRNFSSGKCFFYSTIYKQSYLFLSHVIIYTRNSLGSIFTKLWLPNSWKNDSSLWFRFNDAITYERYVD